MARNNGELKIEYRPIGKLVPYARNAREHSPAQVDMIVKLIQENGWTNPILVDGQNGIIAGHGRLLAAKQMGMKTVPVIELKGMTPARKRAYIAAQPPKGRKVRHIHVDDTAVLLSVSGAEGDDVWELSRDSGHGKEAIHPTQKPVELARRAMRNSTREGEIVLDMFSGSASTLMAGEQLGRSVYCVDLDPLYVDAGIRRWQDATGNHAMLEGRTFDQVAKTRTKHAEKAPAKASRPKAKARAR